MFAQSTGRSQGGEDIRGHIRGQCVQSVVLERVRGPRDCRVRAAKHQCLQMADSCLPVFRPRTAAVRRKPASRRMGNESSTRPTMAAVVELRTVRRRERTGLECAGVTSCRRSRLGRVTSGASTQPCPVDDGNSAWDAPRFRSVTIKNDPLSGLGGAQMLRGVVDLFHPEVFRDGSNPLPGGELQHAADGEQAAMAAGLKPNGLRDTRGGSCRAAAAAAEESETRNQQACADLRTTTRGSQRRIAVRPYVVVLANNVVVPELHRPNSASPERQVRLPELETTLPAFPNSTTSILLQSGTTAGAGRRKPNSEGTVSGRDPGDRMGTGSRPRPRKSLI